MSELELDCVVEHAETGATHTIPCYWAGGDEWRARVRASSGPGTYRCTIGADRQDNRLEAFGRQIGHRLQNTFMLGGNRYDAATRIIR